MRVVIDGRGAFATWPADEVSSLSASPFGGTGIRARVTKTFEPGEPVATTRDIGVVIPADSEAAEPQRLYDRQSALCLGINEYRHVSKLRCAVRDAETVAATLERELGFDETRVLRDGEVTEEDILDAVDKLSERSTTDSLFVLFYAGHGHNHNNSGYLLPADARTPIPGIGLGRAVATWIPFRGLLQKLKGVLRSNHRLLLIDACGSGVIDQTMDISVATDEIRRDPRPAGVALTSGSDQDKVLDVGRDGLHSPFTCALVDVARELGPGRAISPERLASIVIDDVYKSTKRSPRFASALDDLGGPGRIWLSKPADRAGNESSPASASSAAPAPARPASAGSAPAAASPLPPAAPDAPPAADPVSPPSDDVELPVALQRFAVTLRDGDRVLPDDQGRLWLSDGQQVRVYGLGRDGLVARWPLPDIRFKHGLDRVFDGRLVLTDWEGSVLAWGSPESPDRRRVLREARYDDLPVHVLSVGEGGRLAGATWDGRILEWADGGSPPTVHPVRIERLVRHLVPLRGGVTGVVDHSGRLAVLDASGRPEPAWAWRFEGRVDAAWGVGGESADAVTIFAITERHRVVAVGSPRSGDRRARAGRVKRLELGGPVRVLSHRGDGSSVDPMTVAALEDGTVLWVSWQPCRVVPDVSVRLEGKGAGETLDQLHAVHDPRRPAALLALARTSGGRVLAFEDDEARLLATGGVRRVIVDPTGRFVFFARDDAIEALRNPLLSASSSAELGVGEVEGDLRVGAYAELAVTLENRGTVPVHRIAGRLAGRGRIAEEALAVHEGRVGPGARARLTFSVQAIAPGSAVPLELFLELHDEAGRIEGTDRLSFSMAIQ